ncbi:hypothetical protein [Tsukamurella sp. NPDC003166]|uniref:hypothetical protein n=1 Tax=Tsukamurella sp. NPDC003166 TaxID=3154444 RepID=UPI0033ADDF3B
MVGTKHDELWKQGLHHAFPGSSGARKQVSSELEAIRKLRNRLAHHDSMINVDVPFEMRRIHRAAGFLGEDAARWIEAVDRTGEIYREKPHTTVDTVIVPAKNAWDLYIATGAYVCQSGRAFRPVERIAFYTNRAIQPEVPTILLRRDEVVWSEQEANRLEGSDDRYDRKIAKVIRTSRNAGWSEGRYQVFLLTTPGDSRHRTLPAALPNTRSGRGSAFVQKQRYVALHRLEIAETVDDLSVDPATMS